MDVSGIKKSESAFVQRNDGLACCAESRVGRAEDRRIFVEHDCDRNILQNWTKWAFVGEGRTKGAFLQERQDFYGDAACEVDAAIGENTQRKIAGLGAESIGPKVESFDTR